MANIYNDINETIGRTPLVRINRIFAGSDARVLAKLERVNPCGSVKARPALAMIEAAERSGQLKPGSLVVEPTSGNTGISLAMVCAARGYRCILVMPESMSVERRKIILAYGAKIELSPAYKGMKGAVDLARIIVEDNEGAVMPQQFDNPANTQSHIDGTGPEIWDDTDGEIDVIVGGVGTGGTITGVAKVLKSRRESILTVAVEPEDCPLMTQTREGKPLTPGPHALQGIGAGFMPEVLDMSVVDRVIAVGRVESFEYAHKMAAMEGIFAGISTGSAMAAVAKLLTQNDYSGKTIVVIAPDGGEKYLSTGLFG